MRLNSSGPDPAVTSIHTLPNRAHPVERQAQLVARTIRQDQRAIVAVQGEVDPSSVASFEAAIADALTHSSRLVIDLRDVSFMDSTGIRVLVETYLHTGQNAEAFVLRDPSPCMARLLSLVGLDQVITIEASTTMRSHDGDTPTPSAAGWPLR